MKRALSFFLMFVGLSCGFRAYSAVTNTVIVDNYFFNPTNITINVGDSIRWTNVVWPSTTHDVTSTVFNSSPDLDSNPTSYLLRFSNAGAFFYFCDRHVNAIMNRHTEQTGNVFVVSANIAPSVSLTNPANNTKFRAPANILLQATASDDGSVTNVQFFSGATPLGNDTTLPYSFTLNNAGASNYTFTARASDNLGVVTTSAVVNVFVLTNAVLSAPARLPNGQFRFTVQGVAGQTYATEFSTNLANWSAFLTNVAPANTFNITDFTSTNILLRHYRARQDL